MQTLKIATIPLDIKSGDKQANINAVEDAITNLKYDVDLILLPELFTTGFVSDKAVMTALAETNGGETMALLRQLADRHNVALAGSFLAKTASKIYNRAFFVEPHGDDSFYDKRHLFSIGDESSIVSPGHKAKLTVRYRGWNIAVVICYDLRFPVSCRNVGNEYDVLVVPANWSQSRGYAWKHLLIARAIENQSYVLGVNRSGAEGKNRYDNMSGYYDFQGKPIEDIKDDGCLVYLQLNKTALERWRRDFPVWRDCDKFTLL